MPLDGSERQPGATLHRIPTPPFLSRAPWSTRMALDHSCSSRRHPIAERGQDLYETPRVATEALPTTIWEPSAGRGAIVRVLRDRGHAVIGSDVADYGFPLHFCRDFLAEI